MQLSSCSRKLFIFPNIPSKPKLFSRRWFCLTISNSVESNSLESETLKTLEWSSVCKQVAAFTSTTMGSSAANGARLPVGRTPQESQMLLDQTTAARLIARPPDFSEIEDLSGIVAVASSGQLLTIRELCTVRRTLKAAREVLRYLEQLASDCNHPERYNTMNLFANLFIKLTILKTFRIILLV
ncbi:hypothetical protein PIB30_117477 [Stylosanthes scabra]|uniref:Uncharacterized protein n=1 Tax=Stylosanthes scabra TaxID=79078 RepID=A0ABU6XG82_9FABA|nr:hypothetical protein [Stylosanthes scabra]